jgi:hypothetical protein
MNRAEYPVRGCLMWALWEKLQQREAIFFAIKTVRLPLPKNPSQAPNGLAKFQRLGQGDFAGDARCRLRLDRDCDFFDFHSKCLRQPPFGLGDGDRIIRK